VRGQVPCKRLRLKGPSMPIRISHVISARLAMRVILGTVGAFVSLMASVIAPGHLRRRDPSGQKPALGSISGSWLAEYDAKERQGGS
jgi:hypothetical protein